ncbi:TonB-dependent siderophore receptor [Sphingomonas sp. MA1305]|uniref:TonB-dependent siderophore receptor n=1 Tax=Sphingomonas sp. MA1305 TaxID=2479204 RepID=UPI0018DFDDD0|nr:TonB-dependent siderophore receptor [Sphingomonas sp. MA1305]MBI0476290.1 TonB-dependent siderophore receptor [Sphingomonas sp. MA1305]
MSLSRYVAVLLCGTTILAGAAQAQTQRSPESERADIVVTGQQDREEVSSGTKSATPIAETPQSISLITGEDIAELGLQNLNQALRFVAGVTPETRGASAEVYDQFKLRGFDAPVFLDGLKLFQSPTGYAVPQADVSRLDRVEVVKGPASVLYGQSSPGGLVAQTSKLPIDADLYGAITGTYGTYDLYRVDADVGGRAGGDVLWRLYGSANGASTQQRFGKRERQTVSAAVTAGAGTSTSFTLLGAYSHDPYNGTYGVFPALGTLIANPNGRLPTDFDGGEAGNRFQREQAALTYIFRHDFGNGWALRSSGRYQHVTAKLGLIYVSGAPDDATLRRFARASYATDEQLDNWTYDNQLTGRVATGPLTHNLLFGVDRQVAHSTEDFAFGSAPSLDVYAPVYGTVAVPQTPAQVPDAFGGNYLVRQRQQGVYAQDQLALGALRVVLSGRHDWAHAEQAGLGAKDDRQFTWRAGALYTLPFGLAPYVSYATSFEPQGSTVRRADGTLGIADPSLGKQIEAGAKFTVPGTPILLSGAWFRIDQTNVLTSTPDFTVSRQTGRVRSTGVEFEGYAPLPHGFALRAAFSRQSVKVTADADDPSRVGRRLETVGRGGASANLEWSPAGGALKGLTLGGAVRHVDSSYAGVSAYDGIARDTPGYTVYDALIRYDLEHALPTLKGLTLSVNATNLFDRQYLTSCFANYNWCWYGNRRTVQGTIGIRF